jgi:hypothetical protein
MEASKPGSSEARKPKSPEARARAGAPNRIYPPRSRAAVRWIQGEFYLPHRRRDIPDWISMSKPYLHPKT